MTTRHPSAEYVRAVISDHLSQFPGQKFACPVCTAESWNIEQEIATGFLFGNDGKPFGTSPTMPTLFVVPLVCSTCFYAVSFVWPAMEKAYLERHPELVSEALTQKKNP